MNFQSFIDMTTRISVFVLCAHLLVLASGCSRQHYRMKADQEAYGLLACATNDPRWKLDDYRINIDPRSRMFDRSDPDCPPMPPDDPASHCKMLRVDGKKNGDWTRCGCTKCVENPCWRQYLLYNEKGAVSLDKDGAFELALMHSPDYQGALENLYLSALDVSRERFSFDVQFYGGESLMYTAGGSLRFPDGTTLQNGVDLKTTKLFATGGQLVVDMANTVTWTFSGRNSWGAESLFHFNFVQPLLRNAGRKIVLEKLTQQERNFLASVRQMAFFQQGFYTQLITGLGGQSPPSGRISAGFPNVSRSFYGLLEDQIQIQNQRQNILGLEENLDRLISFFESGNTDDILQIEQTREKLLTSQSTLVGQIGRYEANVESYLCSMGLPPDLKVDINDPLMERFQLISPSLLSLQEDANASLHQIRKLDEALPDDFMDRLTEIVRRTKAEIESLRNDLEVLEKNAPKRIEELKTLERQLEERIREGERIDRSVFEATVFEERLDELKNKDVPDTLKRLHGAFTLIELIVRHDETTLRAMIERRKFEPEIIKAMEDLRLDLPGETDREKESVSLRLVPRTPERPAQIAVEQLRRKNEYRDFVRRVFTAFQNELTSLSVLQTRTRLDSITLAPISIRSEDAFEIASENRLDWMNRRAKLVDAWRKIEIAANQLRGDLSVTIDGEIGTVDQNGVRFDGDNGRLQVGLAWDTPLTRHNEMIDYRSAQVEYQAARRDYYTYVDSVNSNLRNILRDIRINQIEFEINRKTILVAAKQVDVAQLKLIKPPERGGKISSTAARDVTDALTSLLGQQNRFLNTWVAYQTQRMLLDLNMGTMELDERGRWIDPGTITKDHRGPAAQYGNRYGGAFGKESGLTPSKRRHHAKKTPRPTISTFPIPEAPRLEDSPAPTLVPPDHPTPLVQPEAFEPAPLPDKITRKATTLPTLKAPPPPKTPE